MMVEHFTAMDTSMRNINGKVSKLQDLCRMCASQCKSPVEIHGPDGIANELSIKFNSYLPVKVAETDTLPLQLCYECTNLLIQWDAAVLVAIAADKKLRALQWQEQKVPHVSKEVGEIPKSSGSSRVPKSPSTAPLESLCCSVCKKDGMDFRELIDHLKTHDMPIGQQEASDQPDTEEQSRKSKRKTRSRVLKVALEDSSSEVDLTVGEGLQVSLKSSQTSSPRRMLRSNQKSSVDTDLEPENPTNNEEGDDLKGRRRAKRFKGQLKQSDSRKSEGGSGDPVVTSSTNSKASESVDGEGISQSSSPASQESSPSDQTTFKPKVRIISAETINQSLEERAKANARNFEQSPAGLVTTIHSVLKPLLPKPMAGKPTRIVIPGGLKDSSRPRFIKLPDGRIIRLLQNPSKQSPPVSKTLVYTSTPTQQAVPKTVFSQLSAKSTIMPVDKQDLMKIVSTAPIAATNTVEEPDPRQIQTINLGNSRIITFNIQPGPKHSVNRFTCAFCGKRNLLQETLHSHAQTHRPRRGDEPVTSPSKQQSTDLSD